MNEFTDMNTKEVTSCSKLLEEQKKHFFNEKMDSILGEKLKSKNTWLYHDQRQNFQSKI